MNDLLTQIHNEIDSANVADLYRQVATNPADTVARIHLTKLTLESMDNDAARHEDKRELASIISP